MEETKDINHSAEVFRKSLIYNGQWDKDTFRDFVDCVYWLRQLLGLIYSINEHYVTRLQVFCLESFVDLFQYLVLVEYYYLLLLTF